VGLATGFLIGDGRFVVTDLGAVAQPGVERAVVRFSGGLVLRSERFAAADPGLGLVALRLEGSGPRRGLPLADRLPAPDGSQRVALVGWPWGERPAVAIGRLWEGPRPADLAARARVRVPAGCGWVFRMAGGSLEAASGAPLVEESGTVVAVHLAIRAPGLEATLAMPAMALRRRLLAGEPRLRPLAELPRPAWPVEVLRLPGAPPKPAGFAGARTRITEAMVCTRCRGRGKVRMEVDGSLTEDTVPCPRCGGEGAALESGVYELLAAWALEGTRAVWAPGGATGVRAAARAAGGELLARLARAGPRFRAAHAEKTALDINRLGLPVPRGLVVYGEVRERLFGPDGPYLILAPVETNYLVAVREADLVPHGGRGPLAGAARAPTRRQWVIMTGAVLSEFSAPGRRGVAVLPFAWRGCPTPGPVPAPGRR